MMKLSRIGHHPSLPGALFFVGGVQFLLMLTLSTALYPDYNVNLDYVSDLGATCRSACTVYQPSATIFNSSTFLFGLLALGGFILLLREKKRNFAYLGLLSSAAAMGVGLLTEETMTIHLLLAILAFGAGALAAITTYWHTKYPFNLFSVLMGLAGLAFLGLLGMFLYLNPGYPASNTTQTLFGLGFGGLERMLVDSIVIWELGFGAYIMNSRRTTL